jgi:hypothetical protein
MPPARLISGLALCACALSLTTGASAESVAMICMWPDGKPTRVVINHDASTVTWSNNNTAPAKITGDQVTWEIPGETNFALNRRSSKIRITGWGGVRNMSNDYACTKTTP